MYAQREFVDKEPFEFPQTQTECVRRGIDYKMANASVYVEEDFVRPDLWAEWLRQYYPTPADSSAKV